MENLAGTARDFFGPAAIKPNTFGKTALFLGVNLKLRKDHSCQFRSADVMV